MSFFLSCFGCEGTCGVEDVFCSFVREFGSWSRFGKSCQFVINMYGGVDMVMTKCVSSAGRGLISAGFGPAACISY